MLVLFAESIPGLGIEDMLDDFVTFFVAGMTIFRLQECR